MTNQLTKLQTNWQDRLVETSFFCQPIHELSSALLGLVFVRKTVDGIVAGRIVEVEAYGGPDDFASHARSGIPTQRTWPMFGPPGLIYIYKIYGRYHCLNIVAPPDKKPGAILIRAMEPIAGYGIMANARGLGILTGVPSFKLLKSLLSGPGKICQAMSITPSLNGQMINTCQLYLCDAYISSRDVDEKIVTTPRIGLNPKTVQEAAHYPWRYALETSPFLSKKIISSPKR